MLPESSAPQDHLMPTSTTEPPSASLRRRAPESVAIFSEQSSGTDAPNHQRLCGACHFSCLKCRTANDYGCSACAPDAQLTERSTNESYCLPILNATHNSNSFLNQSSSTDDRVFLFLIILVTVLSCIVVVLLIIFIGRSTDCCGKRPAYSYDKLATNARSDDDSDRNVVKVVPIRFMETAEDADNDDDSDSDEDNGVERR